METLELGSGRGRVVPGGSVSSFGLVDARRLRGLGGGVLGGGISDTCVLGGGAVLRIVGAAATSAMSFVGEALDFCRLCDGGGVLATCQLTCRFGSYTIQIDQPGGGRNV